MRSIWRRQASSRCLTAMSQSLRGDVVGRSPEMTSARNSTFMAAESCRRKALSVNQSDIPKSCTFNVRSPLDQSQKVFSPWRNVKILEMSLFCQSGSSQDFRNSSIKAAKERLQKRVLLTAIQVCMLASWSPHCTLRTWLTSAMFFSLK